jgi:hypothetical protein
VVALRLEEISFRTGTAEIVERQLDGWIYIRP